MFLLLLLQQLLRDKALPQRGNAPPAAFLIAPKPERAAAF